MAERCEIEVAGVSIIDRCPPDDALFFANNVEGGDGEFGYAQFTWLMIKNCILAMQSHSYIPKFFQFKTVGDELTYEIDPADGFIVVDDSVNISLDGSELARLNDETEGMEKILYTVVYESDISSEDYGKAMISFHNIVEDVPYPLPAGQIMIIKYGIRAI